MRFLELAYAGLIVGVVILIGLGGYRVGWIAGRDSSYLSTAGQLERVTPSGSMMPCIGSNDRFVLDYNYTKVRVGDIIKYEYLSGEDELNILHRVVFVLRKDMLEDNLTYYLTKGDNNPYPDPELVRATQVLGVVKNIEVWE